MNCVEMDTTLWHVCWLLLISQNVCVEKFASIFKLPILNTKESLDKHNLYKWNLTHVNNCWPHNRCVLSNMSNRMQCTCSLRINHTILKNLLWALIIRVKCYHLWLIVLQVFGSNKYLKNSSKFGEESYICVQFIIHEHYLIVWDFETYMYSTYVQLFYYLESFPIMYFQISVFSFFFNKLRWILAWTDHRLNYQQLL
jgi:hypothetical protein